MPSYAVFKSELDSIGTFDGLTNLFAVLAGMFCGCSLGFLWNLIVTIRPADDGWITAVGLTIGMAILGMGTAVLAVVFFCKKKGFIKGITKAGTQAEATPVAQVGTIDYGWMPLPADAESASEEPAVEEVGSPDV